MKGNDPEGWRSRTVGEAWDNMINNFTREPTEQEKRDAERLLFKVGGLGLSLLVGVSVGSILGISKAMKKVARG